MASVETIKARVEEFARGDLDIAWTAYRLASMFAEFVDERCDICDGACDDATLKLADYWTCFVIAPALGIGGSAADYCSSAVVSGIQDTVISVKDHLYDDTMGILRNGIKEHALYPDREYDALRSVGFDI